MIPWRRYLSAAAYLVMGKLTGYTLIEGLPVTSLLRTKAEAEQFNACMREALILVRETSVIRYRRVVRYLRAVQNGANSFLGSFNWPSRICTIDFPKVLRDYPDEIVETLGAILVHESIHGLLWSRGIKTTLESFDAIETACKRAEWRFTKASRSLVDRGRRS